jgi:SnoaL-like polyketide cyclase
MMCSARLMRRLPARESRWRCWLPEEASSGAVSFGEQVLADDAAATEVVFTGTHTGPLAMPAGEIPPTGRAVRTTTVSMLRFRNGMIISERVIGDELELVRQLGVSTPDA